MEIKNGIDLIRIDRISRAVNRIGRPFLQRIWTSAELEDCLGADGMLTDAAAASLAARFAAKEAVAKALGTGIGRYGIIWTDISIYRASETGEPYVLLQGAALQRYETLQGESISISLAHEAGLAVAQCVILQRGAR